MASGKKSFLIYCDVIHAIEHLTDEEKGRLFQHLLEYVNDMNPVLQDRVLLGSWKHIELQLKRDLKKYESIVKRNQNNGKKGGRPKNPTEPKKPTGLFGNPSKPKKADTDTDTDTDNDIVTDINNITSKNSKKEFSVAVRTCFTNCLDFFPDHLKPNNQKQTESWLDTIEKLNKIDKIPLETIEHITEWARSDSFWAKNFLSLVKLRKVNKEKIKYVVVFSEAMKGAKLNGKATLNEEQEINRRVFQKHLND